MGGRHATLPGRAPALTEPRPSRTAAASYSSYSPTITVMLTAVRCVDVGDAPVAALPEGKYADVIKV